MPGHTAFALGDDLSAHDNWFRKESWSLDDEEDFERHLSKSRSKRAQYLKLQAWHLSQTLKPELAAPAIGLANRYLSEDPDGIHEVEAHLIVAQANVTLRSKADALSAYRAAVAAEHKKRGIRCSAYLHYAWFVATNGLTEEFEHALQSMELMEKIDLVFPMAQYKYFGSLALISNALHDADNARRMARDALEAEAKEGPFSRYRDAGIVKYIDPLIQARIRQLAE